MNQQEFEINLRKITPLLQRGNLNADEIISGLEAMVTDQELQSDDATNLVASKQRMYVLAAATPGTDAYQNLHNVLRNHPKVAQIYGGVAQLWKVEKKAAAQHYETEDSLLDSELTRPYFAATPYEKWFVGKKQIEIEIDQRTRNLMREEYLQYCKEREAEYVGE